MKTIAIVFPASIGDVINASPVCVELKNKYPDSKLVFITDPLGMQTAKCIPEVDEVITYDKAECKGLKLFKFALSIRLKEKIDLAVIIANSFRWAALAYLMGAKTRVGRDCQGRGFLLTHKIPRDYKADSHRSEYFMNILGPLNLCNPDYKLSFSYSEEDKNYIENLLENNNSLNYDLIGLCPCSRNEVKDWTIDEAAKFIDYINQNPNQKVALIGNKDVEKFSQQLKSMGVSDFLDLTCKTNIPQLGALIDRFKILITVDTGPAHIAYALKKPSITLFFQNIVNLWGPLNKDLNKVILSENKDISHIVISEFNSF